MTWNFAKLPWAGIRVVIGLAVLITAGLTHATWWPPLSGWIDTTLMSHRTAPAAEEGGHEDHGATEEADHVAATSLELTPQARLNLGLTPDYLQPISLTTYRRSITVPAVVVPKPGRSQIIVSSPLNGVITHVHAVTGEAVKPGDLIFEIRLTYEDLVETQTQYLKTISELDVENREIARLDVATQSGAISAKSLLERKYAKEKLEALIKSQREGLRMHGLSDRQVEAIGKDGKLLRDLQIVAPSIDRHDADEELRLSQNPIRSISFHQPTESESRDGADDTALVIDDLQVQKGQAVMSGERLCSLSDYTQLFIEGKAFEQDVEAVSNAAALGWTVEAVFQGPKGQVATSGLKVTFLGNSIDENSRTLSLFVLLPNEITREETNAEGQRFISWKYRLGQRLQLQVPVEVWENEIVVPVDAVVKEGADWFVFQQNGKHFDRVPVHIKHRDQTSAVIASDGSIFPGDVIALKSAHQMQMAIKNKSGGGADPHAGHTH